MLHVFHSDWDVYWMLNGVNDWLHKSRQISSQEDTYCVSTNTINIIYFTY